MRIRLAILEKDAVYLSRLESVFNVKYTDKLEIYSFTDKDIAVQSLRDKRIDVFLANETFEIGQTELPPNCGFAYLVDTADIDTIRDAVAVCKFQKAELIYRQVLGLFSEKAAVMTGVYREGDGSKVLAFVSAAGGTGNSVAAAGCAMHFAQKGKKALYLNLEKFGSADVFFRAEGTAGLGDVIYAIKSRKGNLAMKLESAVKHDVSGVFFYSPAKLALDIAELNAEEIQQIIGALKMSGGYDYIILDLDFSMDKNMLKIFDECNTIVFVADGSPVSNVKLERGVASLNVLEQQTDRKILMRCGILYNRFSSHTSQKARIGELREFGGISRFEGFDIPRLLQQIKAQPVFDALE
ncbi:MAG: chromosome partitioning protein ParA [Lachnospiraceae bacterium]|nr:chromosome partitioning protein ParA [Lachnospiraceae bacterium]